MPRLRPPCATRLPTPTILMIAAGANAERVKILLADKRVDPNFVSPFGESAIKFAAFNERCGCEVLAGGPPR